MAFSRIDGCCFWSHPLHSVSSSDLWGSHLPSLSFDFLHWFNGMTLSTPSAYERQCRNEKMFFGKERKTQRTNGETEAQGAPPPKPPSVEELTSTHIGVRQGLLPPVCMFIRQGCRASGGQCQQGEIISCQGPPPSPGPGPLQKRPLWGSRAKKGPGIEALVTALGLEHSEVATPQHVSQGSPPGPSCPKAGV